MLLVVRGAVRSARAALSPEHTSPEESLLAQVLPRRRCGDARSRHRRRRLRPDPAPVDRGDGFASRRPRPAPSPSRSPRSSSSPSRTTRESKTTASEDHDHVPEHAEGSHQRPRPVQGVRRRADRQTQNVCKKSIAGKGTANALVNPFATDPGAAGVQGRRRSSARTSSCSSCSSRIGRQAVLHGKISGQKMTIAITPEPAAAGCRTSTRRCSTCTTTLSKKKGSKALISSDRLQVQEAHDRRQRRLRPEPEPAGGRVRVGHGRREVLRSTQLATSESFQRPRVSGAVVVPRLGACSCSRTGSSAAPTSRSPRRCSRPPRRPCSSCRSSRSRSAGRGRSCERCPSSACSASRGRSRSLLGALGVVRLLRRRLRRHRRHRRARARTSRRPRSTSASGSASRSRRCCSATSSGCSARGGRSAAATGWVAGRFAARCRSRSSYPERLGRFPAAVGLFGFAICELCWARGDRARAARDPDARLPRRDAGRDEPVRRRAVGAQRATRSACCSG